MGAPTTGTQIHIEVDGEFSGEVSWETGQPPGYLWGMNLEPGAHKLVLRVETGTLRLDGAERWQHLQPALPEPPDENSETTTRCGCRQTTQSAVLLFPLWLCTQFRRRRHHLIIMRNAPNDNVFPLQKGWNILTEPAEGIGTGDESARPWPASSYLDWH